VLDLQEAPTHPHNVARQSFVEIDGVTQPAPAPRFSRTPTTVQAPAAMAGEHSEEILNDWGFAPDEILALQQSGAI
jgi:alpha-methylacyl-CoA racemase